MLHVLLQGPVLGRACWMVLMGPSEIKVRVKQCRRGALYLDRECLLVVHQPETLAPCLAESV